MKELKQDYSRRLFIRRLFSAGLITVSGSILLACSGDSDKKSSKAPDTAAKSSAGAAEDSKELKCGDYSNVSADEMAKRKKLGYEEITSDPERPCKTCNLFIPKEGKECGGCILFKGPVNNEGSCTYWVEQVS